MVLTTMLALGGLGGCYTIEKLSGDEALQACGDPVLVPGFLGTPASIPADPDQEAYGAAPSPYHVRLNWSGSPSTEATILWRTDEETLASRVEYGTSSAYGSEAVGGSFEFATGGSRVHEVRLCDLQPATTYQYRVGGAGGWSSDFSFTTAPAKGADVPVVIGVAGDARDNQATWGVLLAAMAEKAPDFVIFTGDAVDVGSNMDEWSAWLDAGTGFMESHAIVMAHGNHEFHAQNFYGMVAQPRDELTFGLDYGPVHVSVLNDTAAAADRESQAQWLDGDLTEAESQPWKFVAHHMPAYSSCTTHGSDEELAASWSPVEEEHGVQLDLAGHNHNYERSVPLRGGLEVPAGEGTVYVVAAGAGADLYGNDMANAFTAKSVVTEHYVLLTVGAEETVVTAYDLSDNVIDTFTVPVGD